MLSRFSILTTKATKQVLHSQLQFLQAGSCRRSQKATQRKLSGCLKWICRWTLAFFLQCTFAYLIQRSHFIQTTGEVEDSPQQWPWCPQTWPGGSIVQAGHWWVGMHTNSFLCVKQIIKAFTWRAAKDEEEDARNIGDINPVLILPCF